MSDHDAHGPKKFSIFINERHFELDQESITGAQLKQLANIPSGNKLFLEAPGPKPDEPIGDNQSITLHSGMKFFDLPPGVVGERSC